MVDHSPHHGAFLATTALVLCSAAFGAWAMTIWRRYCSRAYFDSDVDKLAHEKRRDEPEQKEGSA
jgi:hypothetical protein